MSVVKKRLFFLKTIFLFMAILIMCVFLSGCKDTLFDLEELIHPPKLDEEQNKIYAALISSVGPNIKLKYPKTGANRSAFVLKDIDGDSKEESIVFYENTVEHVKDFNDSSESNNVRINLLKKVDNQWVSVYDLAGLSMDIDKVCFNSFDKNGINKLIVGYDLYEGNKKRLVVYTYASEKLIVSLFEDYSYFEILKTSNDNSVNMLVINTDENKCSAKIFNNLSIYSEVPLNSGTKKILNVNVDIKENKCYFYIDYTEGAGVSTEILKYENQIVKNITINSQINFKELSYRPFSYFCQDIDDDGVLEIPIAQVLPGYNEFETISIDQKKYLIKWVQVDGEDNEVKLTEKLNTIINSKNNYYFIIPDSWISKVTVKENVETGSWDFIKYNGNLKNSNTKVLSIISHSTDSLSETKKLDLSALGYFLAMTDNQTSYFMKIATNIEQDFMISKEQGINNLKLISNLGY